MRDLRLKRVGLGTEESSLHTKKSIQKYHSFTITDLEGAREKPQVHMSPRPLQPKQIMYLPPGNCDMRLGAEAARGYGRAGGKHPDAGWACAQAPSLLSHLLAGGGKSPAGLLGMSG